MIFNLVKIRPKNGLIGEFWGEMLKIFEKMVRDTPSHQNFRKNIKRDTPFYQILN